LLFRAVIVLAALPVAVGANLLRVLVMAFLACHFGPESISENRDLVAGVSYHAAWGLLTWLVGLGLFLGVLWWLSRAFPSDEGGGTRNEGRDKTGSFPVPRSSSLAPRLGVAVVFLATTLGLQLLLQGHLRAAEPGTGTGLKRPLAGFPASLGKWMVPEAMAETSARSVMLLGSPLGQGPLQAASALFPHRTVPDEIPTDLEALNHYNKATDRLNRYYIAPAGEPGQWVECQLWMIHSSDGGDRRHHPRICFQVAGFTEDSARRETCLFDDQSASPVRFCFTRGNSCRYVYYWHYTFEPSEGEELTALQRLSQECGVRRPSLTVEIFTDAQNPVHLGEVGKFVEVVDRQLKDYLPPGARRGSDTLPVRQLQVQDGKASHRG
jgi:exosortase/archaeosortase family protein